MRAPKDKNFLEKYSSLSTLTIWDPPNRLILTYCFKPLKNNFERKVHSSHHPLNYCSDIFIEFKEEFTELKELQRKMVEWEPDCICCRACSASESTFQNDGGSFRLQIALF